MRGPKRTRLEKAKADPNSSYWRKKADAAWSLAVRRAGKCYVCGTVDNLQAHHMIDRSVKHLRHQLNNGLCLCPTHHKWDRRVSPHHGVVLLTSMLMERDPARWAWLQAEAQAPWPDAVAPFVNYQQAYTDLTALLEHA